MAPSLTYVELRKPSPLAQEQPTKDSAIKIKIGNRISDSQILTGTSEQLEYERDDSKEIAIIDEAATISEIEFQLNDERAFERLNGATTPDERARFAEKFKQLDKLREIKLAEKLAAITGELSTIEQTHEARLEHYGINKP